ncbi:MAG: tRNA threonylcarbamoyladenosine dehydratase [Clostridia bacterium]|nr:tRNA threonylcarbamoyladenosine dehydratase [Clostridia bacterium]
MNIENANQDNMYTRTEMMLGHDGVEALRGAHVAVFGIGGVGGFAVEALVRAGVGELTLVDSDKVCESNINRQIVATCDTVGRPKVEVARERAISINPCVRINMRECFFSAENAEEFDFGSFDYVVDAIDSVRSKLLLIRTAKEQGTPIISSMGAGNKLDPTRFRVADISKTFADPLAKVIRTELRRSGINHLKVVFSDEPPYISTAGAPGSISFVPSVVGLILAGEVIKDIALGSKLQQTL